MAAAHERVFAWVAVVVVIISAGALSTAAIIQEVLSRQQSTQTASQTIDTCTLQAVDESSTLPAPAPYTASQVSALQTTDITPGDGQTVKSGDCLVVKYYGMLASSGMVFDEDYTKAQALQFAVGKGNVIRGWDEGLIGMKVGGERRLIIPSDLGYGSTGAGSIPANAALVFYVKLIRIVSN